MSTVFSISSSIFLSRLTVQTISDSKHTFIKLFGLGKVLEQEPGEFRSANQ